MDNVEILDSFESCDIESPYNTKYLDKNLSLMWQRFEFFKQISQGQNEYAFKNKVNEVLTNIRSGGDELSTFGELTSSPCVAISLTKDCDGHTLIKFPLSPDEFDELINVCDQPSSIKSFQLAADRFKIANPRWNACVNEELVPRVIQEMSLQHSAIATLQQLQINGEGCSFKSPSDFESENGMFATLIVQLPSIFKGGELVVCQDAKDNHIDFSSNNTKNNGFNTFYSVFYSDCQFDTLPVTSGCQSCLVYNLIADKCDSIPVPPRNHLLQMELKSLFKGWRTPTKLVYTLKEKYSKSNLTFENLTITDKTVANIFKNIAACNDLSVYLAVLYKDATAYFSCCVYHHDFYYLKNLVYMFGQETPFSSSAKINVDLVTEVIPSDVFDTIIPFDTTCKLIGDTFVEARKCYRNAAIVVWPNSSLYPILKNSSGINSDMIDKAFERGVREFINTQEDEQMKLKISNYSNEILLSKCDFELRKCCMKFHDIELARNTLLHFVVFNSSGPCGYTFPQIYSYLCRIGKAYDAWRVLADIMLEMFKNVSKQEVVKNLNVLFGIKDDCNECERQFIVASRSETDDQVYLHPISSLLYEKPHVHIEVGQAILKEILTIERSYSSEEGLDILHSICLMADKIGHKLMRFAKTRKTEEFIPVLVKLLDKDYEVRSAPWSAIGKYIIAQFNKEENGSIEMKNMANELASLIVW